jgi:hypothetical protein
MKSFCCHENAIFSTIFRRYIDNVHGKTQMKIFFFYICHYIDECSWKNTNENVATRIFAMIFRRYIDECSWKNTNEKFLLPRKCYICHDLLSLYRGMFVVKHK